MNPENMAQKRNEETAVCVHCGKPIQAYYCEERLYIVRCTNCNIVAVTTADSPKHAITKTFGGDVGD